MVILMTTSRNSTFDHDESISRDERLKRCFFDNDSDHLSLVKEKSDLVLLGFSCDDVS